MKNWLAQNNNYDRFLIALTFVVAIVILYEPLNWLVLNIWCSIYGIFN